MPGRLPAASNEVDLVPADEEPLNDCWKPIHESSAVVSEPGIEAGPTRSTRAFRDPLALRGRRCRRK